MHNPIEVIMTERRFVRITARYARCKWLRKIYMAQKYKIAFPDRKLISKRTLGMRRYKHYKYFHHIGRRRSGIRVQNWCSLLCMARQHHRKMAEHRGLEEERAFWVRWYALDFRDDFHYGDFGEYEPGPFFERLG